MILRRVTEHVKTQNWTAVAIDFVIVVVGVFIGIQVSNWDTQRADHERETVLLRELREEIAESVRQLEIKKSAFDQVARSGKRALAFLDADQPCGDACWAPIVDFFHASQWQPLMVEQSNTYEELRRNGWPRNRKIVEAVEAHQRQARQIAAPLRNAPVYRGLVRGLIPLAVHEPYWSGCYNYADGEESYLVQCPEGVPPDVSAAGIDAIRNHPDIHRTLTEWTGYVGPYATIMEDQNVAARRAIAEIDLELASRE
ncbi:MAG: hypothetical protein DHS20C11_11090 [Lysobacteraceae bacterium]|nr:MAG: hypothetical protein DHS20C11_11090 [Xanthomonadaceae bacterium]